MQSADWEDIIKKYQSSESDNKVRICIRLDRDVYNYFRSGGPGYQTRINKILRAFVDAQRKNNVVDSLGKEK